MAVLQIGAGSVGWALAHKLAQNNDVVGDLVFASRTPLKAERIIASIRRQGNTKDPCRSLSVRAVDAADTAAVRRPMAYIRRLGRPLPRSISFATGPAGASCPWRRRDAPAAPGLRGVTDLQGAAAACPHAR